MPTATYPVNPAQPGQVSAQIQSTLNGINSIIGYRQDLEIADVVGLSLTNDFGIVSYKWSIIGRPEGSVAGGAGPEPISLGFAPTASFTVDNDDGAFPTDGPYEVQCVVNERSPTETRLRALLVRLNPLEMLDGRVLRLLAANESSEDTADANIRQGFAKMGNRLFRIVMDVPRSPEGFQIGDAATPNTWTGPQPDNVYLAGQRIADPNDTPAAIPGADILYAVPIFVHTSGVIKDVLMKQRAGTTGSARIGLYKNLAKGVYPTTRLFDSGVLAFTGGSLLTAAVNLRVAPGIYWMVTFFDATAIANGVSVDHLKAQRMFPILGTASDLLNAGGAGLDFGVGWRHALAFAALPATFPVAAPVQLQPGGAGLNVPTAFYRWSL